MAELLTFGNTQLIKTEEPIAPITNPLGAPPSSNALSSGAAALAASGSGETPKAILGLELSGAEGMKNALFLSVVGFLVYKYGRRFFQWH